MFPPQGSPLLFPIHCPSLEHPDHPTILNTMFSSSGKSWKNTAFIIKSYSRQSCLHSQLNVKVSLNTALLHLHTGDHKRHKPSAKYWCLVPCLWVSWFRSWIINFILLVTISILCLFLHRYSWYYSPNISKALSHLLSPLLLSQITTWNLLGFKF